MPDAELIRKAIMAHAEWKTRLQKAIETGKVDVSVAKARSATDCQLGAWLTGTDLTAVEKRTDHYQTIKRLHAKFHEEAARIVQLIMVGQKEAATKSLGLLGEYSVASAALTNALAKWEAAGMNESAVR